MNTNEQERLAANGYLSVREAASRVGLTNQALYTWLNNGLVEGVTVGTHRYVLWQSVLDYYKKKDPRALELLGLRP